MRTGAVVTTVGSWVRAIGAGALGEDEGGATGEVVGAVVPGGVVGEAIGICVSGDIVGATGE
jgi:hypothetical protein